MFQVVPEPEFSVWFQTLPAPIAEEVAAAVDMAASSCDKVASEQLSKLLLWFDGTGGQGREPSLGSSAEPLTAFAGQGSLEQVRGYLSWHSDVLRLLESSRFRARLAELAPAQAAAALRSVDQLRRRLRAVRVSGSLIGFGAAVREGGASSVRAAFESLLEQVGLDWRELVDGESGVRELCIHNVEPRLRILFGVDFPGRRLIAILGESLERRYYGDSVRLAEQRFREYSNRARSRAFDRA